MPMLRGALAAAVTPLKDAGEALGPLTLIVKSPAVLVPPLSLTTCFLTRRCAAWSLFVTVQVFS